MCTRARHVLESYIFTSPVTISDFDKRPGLYSTHAPGSRSRMLAFGIARRLTGAKLIIFTLLDSSVRKQ